LTHKLGPIKIADLKNVTFTFIQKRHKLRVFLNCQHSHTFLVMRDSVKKLIFKCFSIIRYGFSMHVVPLNLSPSLVYLWSLTSSIWTFKQYVTLFLAYFRTPPPPYVIWGHWLWPHPHPRSTETSFILQKTQLFNRALHSVIIVSL